MRDLLAICLFVGFPASAAHSDVSAVLGPESRLERRLDGDEVHTYRVALDTGHFFRVEVEQQGLDVAVTFFDPLGAVQLTVDSPNGPEGVEELAVIAAADGEHRLEINAPGGGSGSYQVTVRSLHPAAEQDRDLAKALKIYARSEDLDWRSDTDSRSRALDGYRRTLALLSDIDPRLRARALRRIGQLLSAVDKDREALKSFEQAEALVRVHSNAWELLPLLNDLGLAYYRTGQPTKARPLFLEAVALGERLGHGVGKATALNNLGLLHHSLGELQEALDHYQRALDERRRWQNGYEPATVLQNIGMIYGLLGRTDEGLDFLSRALRQHQNDENLMGQAETLNGIGWIENASGDSTAALSSSAKALALYRSLEDRQGEAVVLDLRGRVFSGSGNFREAREAFAAALDIFQGSGNRYDAAHTLIQVGRLHLVADDPDTALERYHTALAVFRQLGGLHGEAAALVGMAEAARAKDLWDQGKRHFEQALEITESLRARLQRSADRGSFLATRYDDYGAYIDLLMELDRLQPDAGYAEQAFEVSERARARGLLDHLGGGLDDLAAASPEHAERRRQLERTIQAKEKQRLALAGSAKSVHALEEEIRALLLEYEKVRGQDRPSPIFEPLRLAEIRRRALDDETVLLAYHLGKDRSFLWVVGRDVFESHELPAADVLEGLARQAHQLLPRSHERGFQLQAQLTLDELSRSILAPVSSDLASKRLVVLADGPLQLVPFAALPISDEDRAPRPLLAKHEIVYMPSASVAAFLRRSRRDHVPADRLLAMIADPVFQTDDSRLGAEPGGSSVVLRGDVRRSARDVGIDRFERLTYSGEEASAILGLAAAGASYSALGLSANRDVVLGDELSGYRIVHFATHGLLNTRHPELSGIVLSLVDENGRPRDGLLWAHEIAGLDLSAELVVLSACRTALGKEVRGEGILGLARGFFDAGVPRVVVSYWSVDDRATAELMRRFYRAMLREGQPPAGALRSAQLSMLAEDAWQAPYYWAGFALQGDWQ